MLASSVTFPLRHRPGSINPHVITTTNHVSHYLNHLSNWESLSQLKINKSYKMVSVRVMACFVLVLMTVVHWTTAYPTVDKESLQNELESYDDNGPENGALLYKLLKRLGTQMVVGELQRKRSYWKQCAFNAVSCYGK